jgi:curved DNA-binding protein CbpA
MRAFVILSVIYLARGILDRSLYEALEVPVSASQADIREAFRRLSRKYHPDRNPEVKGRF